MACNCKHNAKNILRDAETLKLFRRYFIRRMTEEGSYDMRKRDFNQPIFAWHTGKDYAISDPDDTFAVYGDTDMGMVLKCFDDAMRDFRKRYCDQHKRTKFEE